MKQTLCYNLYDLKGEFKVCLTVTSSEGCKDDTCQIIDQ